MRFENNMKQLGACRSYMVFIIHARNDLNPENKADIFFDAYGV